MKGFLKLACSVSFALSFICVSGCGGEDAGPQPSEDTTLVDTAVTNPNTDLPQINDPGSTSEVVSTQDLAPAPNDVAKPDTSTKEDVSTAPEPGQFGWPCTENSECDSFCLPVNEGKACTQSCIDSCPQGFRCELIEISGQDQTFLCVSLSQNLCRPCNTHGDCAGLISDSVARCISYGETTGSFCGSDCSGDVGCPAGYSCESLLDPADSTSYQQCLPLSGACECSANSINEAAETDCGNDFCGGTRVCGPDGLTECSANTPSDEECDGEDNNCDGVVDNGFLDTDEDGAADCVDLDDDEDGVPDEADTCPLMANPGQEDLDSDSLGDLCDPDDDGDDVPDTEDNCPLTPNPSQEDDDSDQVGNACEDDADADGIVDDLDNCPNESNAGQNNFDGDELGDLCDPDDDNDGLNDDDDNCPFNAESSGDLDEDGFGDLCDIDLDGDEVNNGDDNCPNIPNDGQEDADDDGLGDLCDACMNDPLNDADLDSRCADADNCPTDSNPSQLDTDLDGIGDACDVCVFDDGNDADGDSVCDDVDNCPGLSNPAQLNTDNDVLGNDCDDCPDDPSNDADGDGHCGGVDNCPGISNPEQLNADDDALGDACDGCINDPENDIDGDGHCAGADNCPALSNPDLSDVDGDDIGDVCDTCPNDSENDTDGDSVCGDVDNCPTVSNTIQADEDGDNVGDLCDPCPLDPLHTTSPPAATAITGQTNVNGSQSGIVYSIPEIATAYTYHWTVPPGASITEGQTTHSVHVDFGVLSGEICVTASNGCGSSSSYCIAIEVSNVPQGVIAMWASTLDSLPAGWVLCDGSNGTPDLRSKYIKGAVSPLDVGASGGSAEHSHGGLTGSTDLTTGDVSPSGGGGCGSGCSIAAATHSHSQSHQHGLGSSSNQPRYKEVLFIMNMDGSPLSPGIVTAWNGDAGSVPFGWNLANGSGGTPAFNGVYPVGAPDGLGGGDSGGVESHDHGSTGSSTSSLSLGLDSGGSTECGTGPTTAVGHAHDYTHQHQLPEFVNDLPYYTAAFLQSTSATSLPVGTILMWHGSSFDVPTGWALCNGAAGTPDLRDRYIRAINNGEPTGLIGGSPEHDHGGFTLNDGGGTTGQDAGIGCSTSGSSLLVHEHTVNNHQHSILVSANHEPPHTMMHFIIRK